MVIKIKIESSDLGFSPKQVKSLLGKLNKVNLIKKEDVIEVDCDFNESDTCELSTAIIWSSLREAIKIPCKGKNFIYKGKISKYFDERHFFDSLTGKKSSMFSSSVPINYETFSPIRPTQDNTRNDELTSIFNSSTNKILNKSNEFEEEVGIHIIECIQNAFDHSESKQNKPAGIVCSLSKTNILDFCVVDIGQGIKSSFLSNPYFQKNYSLLSDIDLIIKSTEKNVSCNPHNFPNPNYSQGNGGIGLYYLNKFIQMHPGSCLVIISGSGYYYTEYSSNLIKKANLNTTWPGTIVYFRVKLGQDKTEAYKNLNADFIAEFDNR